MALNPGFLGALPSIYQDSALAELALELGLSAITPSEWEDDFTSQTFTGLTLNGNPVDLPNPAADARWAYHEGAIQTLNDSKQRVLAKAYGKRIAMELWLPAVNAQIDVEVGG